MTMPSPKGDVFLGDLPLCRGGAGRILPCHPRCWSVKMNKGMWWEQIGALLAVGRWRREKQPWHLLVAITNSHVLLICACKKAIC